MRTIIELTDEQVAALKAICAREGISRAEAVRRAVDQYVDKAEGDREAARRAMDSAFGAWAKKGIDTDTYLDEIGSEWER